MLWTNIRNFRIYIRNTMDECPQCYGYFMFVVSHGLP